VPLTASEMHIADLVAEDESRRLNEYERAWKAYDGEGPTYLDTDEGHDDNIRFDYPALIVDKGVSFLLGKDGGVSFQPSPPEPAEQAVEDEEEGANEPEAEEEDPEAQTARAAAELDDAWPPMRRGLDLHDLATNGGICGHAWVRVYRTGRVSVLDPANCSAEWDENDVGVLERYFVQWTTADEETGLGVVRRWRIEPNEPLKPSSWTIALEEHNEDANDWVLLDEEAWPYDFAPIVEGKNLPSPNTFYGRADLSPSVLDMIEQLESVASDMRRMLRLQGHPVPVIFGETVDKLQALEVGIGELLAIPNEKAKLGQLVIAELTSAMELFKELKTALFEGTHIPKVALGETGNAGPTTGVALKVEYEPLSERTGTKHLTYGWVISEIARRILELRGLKGWTISLGWPDSTPSDPKADAEADESEIRMKVVSRRTIAEKRGYDWDEEQKRMAEEAEAGAEAAAKALREGNFEDE
jgi:Phage portal protein, SPP1 Gp6-like